MFWIAIMGLLVLMTIAIIIYLMPAEPSAKKKKKKEKEHPALMPDPAKSAENKDWKAIAQRWEKTNHALMGDVEKLKMQEKKWSKDIDDHKVQIKDLMDKLALEKGWREKEQANLDKSRHHEKDLKDQLIRTEKDLEKEHSQRLKLERDLQEMKIKYDAAADEKRTSSTKAMSLETTVTALNKEVKELKSENAKLKEKREDIQWVAKSAYDELKQEFDSLKKRHGA